MNVGDDAVGYDEEDKVVFAVLVLFCYLSGVVDDGRKIGGPEELNGVEDGTILQQNFIDAGAVGMARVAVKRELMRDLVVGWNFCTET